MAKLGFLLIDRGEQKSKNLKVHFILGGAESVKLPARMGPSQSGHLTRTEFKSVYLRV